MGDVESARRAGVGTSVECAGHVSEFEAGVVGRGGMGRERGGRGHALAGVKHGRGS